MHGRAKTTVCNFLFFPFDFQATDTRWGWTVGAGLEYAFTSRLSAKVEYNYLGFGTERVALANTSPVPVGLPASVPLDINQHMHLIKLGMNYHFGRADAPIYASGPAYDGPRYTKGPQPPPPVPYFSWTGLYIGAHVGGGWGRKDWGDRTDFFGVSPFPFADGNRDHDGFIGGGQIGANYQLGPWVIGAGVDASGSDIDGFAVCTSTLLFRLSYAVESLGTITGRVGATYGNLLLYFKAGGAWADENTT